MRLSLGLRSLRGQMIALVLIGLVISQLLGFVIFRLQHEHMLQALREDILLARVASVVRLLAETSVEVHTRILHAISTPPLQFSIAPEPARDLGTASRPDTQLCQQLAVLLDTDSADIRIERHVMAPSGEHWSPPPPATALAVAVRLTDGRWLNAVSLGRPPRPLLGGPPLLSMGLTALILSGLMILMVRRITRPLAQLAMAADRLGRGETGPPLAEYGPLDIQEAIRAFNHMRARLERFVQDRTRMLAAISHDLRTPLTALRVRAELIEDGETRDTICATLAEIQHMTEATLAFVREDAVQEDTRLLDLDALIQSVCDDLSDAGQDVTFCGPGKLPYRGRAMSLKRALRNLVENAVTWGEITLANRPAGGLRVTVHVPKDGTSKDRRPV